MRPERRLEGRNGGAAAAAPKDQISDSVVHNLLEPKNGLDFGVHLTRGLSVQIQSSPQTALNFQEKLG